MESLTVVTLVSVLWVIHAASDCMDYDSNACVMMQQKQPDLCTSDLANSACPLFCGICGTTTTSTTTAATPILMSATQQTCDDIDSSACILMHQTRPDLCSDESLANAACKRFCGKCPVECFSCSDLVMDISQCSNLTMCNLNEACYQMEVFDFDRSHGFRTGCISKNLCVPHGTEIFGRSSSTVRTTCCDTDRCNGEIPTTTPQPTTTTTTYFHGHHTHRPCVDDLSASKCSAVLACLINDIHCRQTCGLCH